MTGYRVTGLFRRTVAAIPCYKRLVPVRDAHDWPLAHGTQLGQLCPDVLFRMLEDGKGGLYWAKQWLNERQTLLAVTQRIERFLAGLDQPGLMLAVEQCDEFGLVYPFDESLFCASRVVHQWDLRWYFSDSECASIRRLADVIVRWHGLPEVALGQLTDFQTVRHGEGLKYIDFEPSRGFARALAGVGIP